MPQLDALRAFAVGLVILEHWLPHNQVLEAINPGYIGVVFFFVLSGFLITKILLKNRTDSDNYAIPKAQVLKKFIIRRALRIFPIYYITIFACFAVGLASIREKFIWYVLYLSNYFVFYTQNWGGPLTHLWTLAVEEQFYLFWPLIILFVPTRWLLLVISSFVVIGPLSRFLIFTLFDSHLTNDLFALILTPSCLDAFGIGAVLAYFKQENSDKQTVQKTFSILLVTLLSLFAVTWLIIVDSYQLILVIKGSIIALASVWVIHRAGKGFEHPLMKSILENGIVVYLGKISYGIYLFHNFIPYLYTLAVIYSQRYNIRNPLTNDYLFTEIQNPIVRFIIFLSLLILFSAISWHLVEKPINNLKKQFQYVNSRKVTSAST
ncbi:acyltransferase family protein [Tunicatimonas pelagia]|uniref:acyltransferase family protein n=1 Tax=Tunicatimonas pelagia TaxID=931531 RepID=UPI0026667152|nr:acyltransferase [Tunicatimonas pelagia]WKN42313.1 acyltransferase [Tunicatimonas pelagia]